MYAMTATAITVPRLIHMRVFSLASFLKSLNISLLTEEAVTRSWESAVLMIAARIAASTIPAMIPGRSLPLRNMKILSASPMALNSASIASLPAEFRKM